VLFAETTNTNVIVFELIGSGTEFTINHTQYVYTNHYTTEAVIYSIIQHFL